MELAKKILKTAWFVIISAIALQSSGIIPAIIPQAVPVANKVGNSTKFQLAGTVAGTAALLCTDANQNSTTSGCPGAGPTGPTGATGATGATGNVGTSGNLTTNVMPRAAGATTLQDGGITDDGAIMSAVGRNTISIGTTSNSVPANCCGFYAVTSASSSYLWGRGAAGPTVAALNVIGQKAAGTIASPTDTVLDSLFYFMAGRGYIAASGGFQGSSKVAYVMLAAENWTSSANGTYMTFETTPNTTTTRFENLRVCDNGNIVGLHGTALGGYGTVCAGGYKLDVQKSGTTGTAKFQDQTASTGATRVLVDLGAADTAPTETVTNNGADVATGFRSSGYTFATLPSSTNGTFIYCSDCDPAAAGGTCTNAGAKTGNAAFRLNGAWKCF